MSSQPFAPVSAEELEKALAILREVHKDERLAFATAGLCEPSKSAVKSGDRQPRIIRFQGSDSKPDGGFEADIDVTAGNLKSLTRIDSQAQGSYNFLELFGAVHLNLSQTR